MAENTLVAPISLNGIFVDAGLTVTGAKADFSRLPWTDGNRDHNFSTPFLGESVLSPPFEDRNFILGAGVHLHWVLPKSHRSYYTHKTSNGTKKETPAAPNRWLVTRNGSKSWVVESDYLSTSIGKYNKGAVTVPNNNLGKTGQPYSYLGRQLPLEEWLKHTDPVGGADWPTEFTEPLTAFGYGDLSFNTHYPNCCSVFGFFDPSPGNVSNGVEYTVLGWYADASDDIVKKTHTTIKNLITKPSTNKRLLKKILHDKGPYPSWMDQLVQAAFPSQTKATQKTVRNLRANLLSGSKDLNTLLGSGSLETDFYNYGIQLELDWVADADNPWTTTPKQSLYWSSINVDKATGASTPYTQTAIGRSVNEAASVYLANELGNETTIPEIEEQLNAIFLSGAVKNDTIDVDLNLREAQSNHTFKSHDAGILWRVRKLKSQQGESGEATPENNWVMPKAIAALLTQLNDCQTAYHKGLDEVIDQQEQVYANWCKFMHACYPPQGEVSDFPDIDQIKAYLEWELEVLRIKKISVGQVTLSTSATSQEEVQSSTGLSQEVEAAYTALQTELSSYASGTNYSYELSHVPAPRFYQPKDPVVLFAKGIGEDSVEPSSSVPVVWANPISISVPLEAATQVEGLSLPSSFKSASANAPSEGILQWLISFFPESKGGGTLTQGNYATNYITKNFETVENEFDLKSLNEKNLSQAAAYSGSAYTVPGTAVSLEKDLGAFLITQSNGQLTDSNINGTPLSLASFSTFFPNNQETYSDLVYTAFKAYNLLVQKTVSVQSLGGFYGSLLQERQNVQLPIQDPLAFSAYSEITSKVSEALTNFFPPGVHPSNQFLPISAGELLIDKIDMIDDFGRSTPVTVENPYIADAMKPSTANGTAWLNPRLAQESKLNFRWLSGLSGLLTDVEMNSHPDTTPICGWLWPDNFNNSLMAYDAQGKGIGQFTTEGWKPFPLAQEMVPDDFSSNPNNINPHLFAVLKNFYQLTTQSDTGLNKLLDNIENAQASISPQYFSSNNSLALLMGKPIAIVRAQLSLQTKGGLKNDQGWVPMLNKVQNLVVKTDGYQEVSFPVRLGENGQLSDGLIAYWQESATGIRGQANWVNPEDNGGLTLSLGAAPVNITLLMDPHALVHATTGILPVKTINIPHEYFSATLKKMEMLFRIQPVLTPAHQLQLSLPKEKGYEWQWLQHGQQGAYPPKNFSTKANFHSHQQLLEGYLKLTATDPNND